jgi:hypothetical protein
MSKKNGSESRFSVMEFVLFCFEYFFCAGTYS